MNWKILLQAAPFIALAVLGWRYGSLEKDLLAEQATHKQTQVALADAVTKGNGWKAAYEEAGNTVEAHRQATQACLDRETEARAASQEREAILQASQPRPRTQTEQTQVVGNETRKRTAHRLNRPL